MEQSIGEQLVASLPLFVGKRYLRQVKLAFMWVVFGRLHGLLYGVAARFLS